jgi:Fic family protein
MDKYLTEYTENYLNKPEVGYRLPAEIKLEEFWAKLLAFRKQKAEKMQLIDQAGGRFWYVMTHPLQKKLHEIDSYGRDSLYEMVKEEIESELIKESLIEEAFYSSVIEGAFTTLKKAKAMVEKREPPKDNSEQMVLNNYNAMRFILENRNKELSEGLILELHKIVTEKTLEDQCYAGKYRDDVVYVTDDKGEVIYAPPKYEDIPRLMSDLIGWLNTDNESSFIHPIIKAAILHFYFVYLHPFFDGNGRTARALFYFYLIRNKYEFFRYFSISSIISASRSKYYKSLKDVEDYGSDMTYFLIYMADAIAKAIFEIKEKITKHYKRDYVLAKIREKKIRLNDRQDKFIKKFLIWKDKIVNIEKYKQINGVVYQTARADLLDLVEKKVLIKNKQGRSFNFSINPEL